MGAPWNWIVPLGMVVWQIAVIIFIANTPPFGMPEDEKRRWRRLR